MAQRKVSEEQSAADDLRKKLKNEEAACRDLEKSTELQWWSCDVREVHDNGDFRAAVDPSIDTVSVLVMLRTAGCVCAPMT